MRGPSWTLCERGHAVYDSRVRRGQAGQRGPADQTGHQGGQAEQRACPALFRDQAYGLAKDVMTLDCDAVDHPATCTLSRIVRKISKTVAM